MINSVYLYGGRQNLRYFMINNIFLLLADFQNCTLCHKSTFSDSFNCGFIRNGLRRYNRPLHARYFRLYLKRITATFGNLRRKNAAITFAELATEVLHAIKFCNNRVLSVNRHVSAAMSGCVLTLLVSFSASAATAGAALKAGWNSFSDSVAQTWSAPQHYDLYVPAITWHNRWTYDDAHIRKYNERPWGAGGGISRWDDKGNWNGLYVMAFKDSFNKWEPIAGYGWEATWRPLQDQRFHLGAGYTAGFTARDNWKYIPVPLVLPLASVGYGPATFQMTYIPGTYNNGNVYFAWLRFQF